MSVKTNQIDTESASYAQLRTEIKQLREQSDDAKDHFGDYTHFTTQDLRELLQEWYDNNDANESAVETEAETNHTIAEVVNLLHKAIELLGTLPQVSVTSEFETLKAQAELVEFELFQKG